MTINPTPGRRIRHSYLCTRSAAIAETIRRDATGRAYVTNVCCECKGSDFDSVLIDNMIKKE